MSLDMHLAGRGERHEGSSRSSEGGTQRGCRCGEEPPAVHRVDRSSASDVRWPVPCGADSTSRPWRSFTPGTHQPDAPAGAAWRRDALRTPPPRAGHAAATVV